MTLAAGTAEADYGFLELEVADVMSEPLSIGPETKLAEVERILEETGFNGLPVVEGGVLVGFVTSLDLLRAFTDDEETLPSAGRILGRPVDSVMRIDPLVVQPRTPLSRAMEKMVRTRNKSFPVVDADYRLVGMVSRADVMSALRRS